MLMNNTRKSKRNRKSRRKGNSNAFLIAGTAALVMTAVGGLGYGGYKYAGIERPDEFGCYARNDQHQTVIYADYSLIDQSGTQLRDYAVGALATWDQTPANGRVMIATSARDTHSNLISPTFVLCKPAKTEAEQNALGIPLDGKLVRERNADEARQKFIAMMNEMIAEARNESRQAMNSPILEQVRAISRAAWFQGPSRDLTLITDGLQSSKIAQFCAVQGHMPPFGTFANKLDYQWVKPDNFIGTDVTVLMVEALALPQPSMPFCSGHEEVRTWWKDYFVGNDANTVTIEPLGLGVGG